MWTYLPHFLVSRCLLSSVSISCSLHHPPSRKDNVRSMRIQAIDLEYTFAKDTSGKRLYSKIYKKDSKFNRKETNDPLKKSAKDFHKYITKEDAQMVNEHTKKYSTSYVIREMQVKTMSLPQHTYEKDKI